MRRHVPDTHRTNRDLALTAGKDGTVRLSIHTRSKFIGIEVDRRELEAALAATQPSPERTT